MNHYHKSADLKPEKIKGDMVKYGKEFNTELSF